MTKLPARSALPLAQAGRATQGAAGMLLADVPVLLLEQSRAWILKKPYVTGAQGTPMDPGPFLGGLFVTRIYIANH